MASLFQNNQAAPQIPPRQKLEAKYNAARANLMLAVAFTLINVVILLSNGNSYFLFSLYVPYLITDIAMFYCGKYPAELYTGEFADMEFLNSTAFAVLIAIAAVILVVYALCWLLSSKGRVGWMIAALVLFSIDTALLFLIGGLSADMLLDILFHIWVLYYLIAGVIAHFKLKTLPPDEEPVMDGIVMEVSNEEAPVTPNPSEPSDGDDKTE